MDTSLAPESNVHLIKSAMPGMQNQILRNAEHSYCPSFWGSPSKSFAPCSKNHNDHNGHTVVEFPPPRGGQDGPELRWHVPSARPWCKWRPARFFKWRCKQKWQAFFVKSYHILNICLKPLRWYWFSDSIILLLYSALVVQATLMTHFFLCQKTPLSQSFSNLHGPPTKVPNLVTLEASHSYASRNLLLRPVEQGRVNESITCSKCCANSFATLATFQITTTKAHLGH